MAIKSEEFKKFEEKNRRDYMYSVELIFADHYDKINELSDYSKSLGKKRVDLPNVGITCNNKIGEISRYFEEIGASMFASEIENYGQDNTTTVIESLVGDAIIYDLLKYVQQANGLYREYEDTLMSMIDKRPKQLESLEDITPIQRIWAKIKSLFVNIEPEDIALTPKEEWYLEDIILDCQEIDNQIWEYNWEEYITNSISNLIYDKGYQPYEVPAILEEFVYPEMKKTGLEERIPELQQVIAETYKQNVEEMGVVISEENKDIYIPNFEKKNEADKEEIVPKIIKNLSEETEKIIESSKTHTPEQKQQDSNSTSEVSSDER